MMDSIPLLIQRDEVQLLQRRLNGAGQFDRTQALSAWDWEYIVSKCLQFPRELEIGWKITCREAMAGEIKNFQAREESLRTVGDLMIDVAQMAYQKARAFATAAGQPIEGLEQLK